MEHFLGRDVSITNMSLSYEIKAKQQKIEKSLLEIMLKKAIDEAQEEIKSGKVQNLPDIPNFDVG